jgi:hypothetical protein
MAGRLGDGETGDSRWTPGRWREAHRWHRCSVRRAGGSARCRDAAWNRGAIGDGGRHRTQTRRHGGGDATRSDRRRGGLDGAWQSSVGAQGPVAWGGALRMARVAPVA